MLRRLKALIGNSEKSQLQRTREFDFSGKPTTKALCLRAASLQDEASRDLKQMGARPALDVSTSVADMAQSAAITVAYHIAIEACAAANTPIVYLPLEPSPKAADATVAFSLFALAGIKGSLEAEGTTLNFAEAAARIATQFYFGHQKGERAVRAQRGIALFQTVARARQPDVVEWQEHSLQLVSLYLTQLQTSNEDLKQEDLRPLFGDQLAALIASVK